MACLNPWADFACWAGEYHCPFHQHPASLPPQNLRFQRGIPAKAGPQVIHVHVFSVYL
jgi:hypothetical protein